MKSKVLSLILTAALALFASTMPAAAEAPFSTDLELNSTNATADFELAEAVQPVSLRLYGVLPLQAAGQTVVVTRVHGDLTQTLHSFALGSNVASATTTLTNAPWILLGDEVRIAGPTNAILEFQGDR